MVADKATRNLTPASIDDLPLINRWLVQPEIRRWWGSPLSTQIEMRLGIMVPDEIGRVFLIKQHGSAPIGLVSIIHAKALARSSIVWPKFLPPKAWEIGILIEARCHRQRGLGTKALLEAQSLVLDRSSDPVFAWIEKDNKASLATFERLGYHHAYEAETAKFSSVVLQYNHYLRD